MADIKQRVSKELNYKTAIVDRHFLNQFIKLIKAPLVVESIKISDGTTDIIGTDINELLDTAIENRWQIASIWITASEPFENVVRGREQKRIRLFAIDILLSIEINGDELEWLYGIEKTIDTIVNQGSRRHRLAKNEVFVGITLGIMILIAIGAVTADFILILQKHPLVFLVWTVIAVSAVIWVFAALSFILYSRVAKNRVIIVAGNYKEEKSRNKLSSRDWKIIFVTFAFTALLDLIIRLIELAAKQSH